MPFVRIVAWIVALVVAIEIVMIALAYGGLLLMFPKQRRWWQLPAELAALALFAAVVLNHPF